MTLIAMFEQQQRVNLFPAVIVTAVLVDFESRTVLGSPKIAPGNIPMIPPLRNSLQQGQPPKLFSGKAVSACKVSGSLRFPGYNSADSANKA